jgi:hypothetical protein
MRDAVLLVLTCAVATVAVYCLAGFARALWAVHCARCAARRYVEPPMEVHLAQPGKVLRFERLVRLEHEGERDGWN